MVHDPDFDRVSAALHALRPGSPVDAKLAALRGLVAYWHGPIEPWDGVPAAALAGPAPPRPLRWWHG